MESWRVVWRQGFVPVLSTPALLALKKGLIEDDSRLLQGATTSPPPLICVQDWPCDGADALGYAGWQGDGLTTVGEVEEHFAQCCFQADERLGEPAACRFWLNHWDDEPRDVVFRELLAEVELALSQRVAVAT